MVLNDPVPELARMQYEHEKYPAPATEVAPASWSAAALCRCLRAVQQAVDVVFHQAAQLILPRCCPSLLSCGQFNPAQTRVPPRPPVVHTQNQPVFVGRNSLLESKMAPIGPCLLKIAAPDLHHWPVFVKFVAFCVPKKIFF
jgi:hypothetical protein